MTTAPLTAGSALAIIHTTGHAQAHTAARARRRLPRVPCASRVAVRAALSLLIPLAVSWVPGPAQAAAADDTASTWTYCARETAVCAFTGRRQVIYAGKLPGQQMIVKVLEAGARCEDLSFGAPGSAYENHCWVLNGTTAASAGTVLLQGIVAIGASGSNPPVVGQFTVPGASDSASSAPTWSYCARETGTCAFTGRRQVMYGGRLAGQQLTVKVLEGGTRCDDSAFGMPFSNYENHCWVSSATVSAAIGTRVKSGAVTASVTGTTAPTLGAAPVTPPVTATPTLPTTPPAATSPSVPVAPAPAPATANPSASTGATASASAVKAGPRVSSYRDVGPIAAVAGQVIAGVRIANPNGPCIVIQAPNVVVRDSFIGPCKGGANIAVSTGGDNALIEYNDIQGGERGVLVNRAAGVITRANRLSNFTGALRTDGSGLDGIGSAIEYDYVAGGGLVESNEVTGTGYVSDAVSFFESSNMRFLNNLISVAIAYHHAAGFTMGDMRPGAGTDPGHNNYIAGNIVRQTGGVPAGVFGSSGNTVVERNCFSAGIQAYNYSGVFTGVTVRRNVIDFSKSFTPDTGALLGWSTNINGTDCRLVPS